MLVDYTLVIVKPDAVERGLIGEILSRLEKKQLSIAAAQLRHIDLDTARQHYAEHEGKPFYEALTAFLSRGPSLLVVVGGPTNVWQIVRTMMGATDPALAAPGTIRGDLALAMRENLIHGSDSSEAALREIAHFFPEFPL